MLDFGRRTLASLAGAMVVFGLATTAGVAQQVPAVSGPNGKLEFNAGLLDLPSGSDFLFRAAGSLSIPVGERFGIQGDVAAVHGAGGLGFGGAAHVFTRDPAAYLLGGTVGFVRAGGASLLAAGPEAELYFDRLSIEAWGGFAGLTYDDPAMSDKAGLFLLADIAYYATDDLRFAAGVASVIGYNSLHLGAEYLIHAYQMPVSLAADARFGQDGAIAATLGLKAYIGGRDTPLIARHRQDDPRNRAVDLGPILDMVPAEAASAGGGGDIPQIPI